MPRRKRPKLKRVRLNHLYRRFNLRGLHLRGVGDLGPGSQFTSSGPHGESSLAAQRQGVSSLSDVTNFVQGEAEAVNLAHEARPNDPTVFVDDEGFIVGADTTPEDSEPGVVNEPEVVITGTRTPSGGFSRAPGPAPSTFPAPSAAPASSPAKSDGPSGTSILGYLLLAAAATKAVGVW